MTPPPPESQDAMTRRSHKTAFDDRGITLQTLIILAVSVLIAVVASVLLVALARSSQDDLESIDPDVQGGCMPWEISDPTLAAAGKGGGQGGVGSSAPGCQRVCYVLGRAAQNIIGEDDFFIRDPGAWTRDLALVMTTDDIATSWTPHDNVIGQSTRLVVTGRDLMSKRNTDRMPSRGDDTSAPLSKLRVSRDGPRYDPERMILRVAPNGAYCEIYDLVEQKQVFQGQPENDYNLSSAYGTSW